MSEKKKRLKNLAVEGSLSSPDSSAWYFDSDPRPLNDRTDSAHGLPTWDALYHLVDPSTARLLHELDKHVQGLDARLLTLKVPPSGWWTDEEKEQRQLLLQHQRVLRQLSNTLLAKLQSGELVAEGFASTAPIDAPRRKVPAERWLDLNLDVINSRAHGEGVQISKLLVTTPGPRHPRGQLPSARVSEAVLRDWYKNRQVQLVSAGATSSADEDFQAAKEMFGTKVSRERVRKLRRDFVPDDWKKRGRKPSSG